MAVFSRWRRDPVLASATSLPGAKRGPNYARGVYLCSGCGQSTRYSTENPGRFGTLSCPRCLCAPGERTPPPESEGGPSVLVHVYRLGMLESDPLGAYAREAPALGRAGWRIQHQTQSGQQYVGLRGWQPTAVTATYERDQRSYVTGSASPDQSASVPSSSNASPPGSSPASPFSKL